MNYEELKRKILGLKDKIDLGKGATLEEINEAEIKIVSGEHIT